MYKMEKHLVFLVSKRIIVVHPRRVVFVIFMENFRSPSKSFDHGETTSFSGN
jgi:hypothetical protein